MKASDGRKKKNREKRIALLQEQLKRQQALKRGRGRPKSQPKSQLLHPPTPQAAKPPEKTPKPQLSSEPKQTEAEVPQSSIQPKQQLKQQSAEIKQEGVKFPVNKETTSKRESLKKSDKTSPSQASSAQADIMASVTCKTEATTSVKAEQGLQKRQRHRKSFFEVFSAEVHKPHYRNRSKGKEADKEVIVIPDNIEIEEGDKNNESSNTKLDGATAGSSSKSSSVQSPDSIARRRQRRSINRFSRLPVESSQIADDTSLQKLETEPQSKKLSKGLQKLAEKVQQEEYEPVNQPIQSLEQRDKKELVSRKGKSKFGKKNAWLTRQRKPILKNQQKQAEEQLPPEQHMPAVQQSTAAQQLPAEQQLQAKLSQRLEAKSPSRYSAPEETNTLEVSGRKRRLTSKSSPIRTSRRTSRLSDLTQQEQSSAVSDGATVVVTEDKILPSSSVPAEGHQDEPIFPVSGKWIEVTCGSNTAHLCLDLTGYSCSGPQGERALNKSVLYQGTMISPAELEAFSGVSNSRDWKRSLWHSGESIRNLIKSRALQLSDNACCVCEACEAKKSSVEKSRETISGKALKTKPGQRGASSEVKDLIDGIDEAVQKEESAQGLYEVDKTTGNEPDPSAVHQSGSNAAGLVDSNVELSEEKTEIMKIENPSDVTKASKQIDVKTRKRTTYNSLSSETDVYPSMGRRSGRSAENQESRSADRSADTEKSGRKRKRNSVDESVKRCKVSIESHPDLAQHVVVTVTSNEEKQSQHDDVSNVEIVKLQEDVKSESIDKGKKTKKIVKGKKNSVTNVVSAENKDIAPVLTNEENSLKSTQQNSTYESLSEDEPQTSKSIEIPDAINETDDGTVMEPALAVNFPQAQVDDSTLSDDDAEVVQKTGIKRKRRHRKRTFTILKKRSAGKPKNLAESETKSENLAESETETKPENPADSETEIKFNKSKNPSECETETKAEKSENPAKSETETKSENLAKSEIETKSDKSEYPAESKTETKSDKSDVDEKCKSPDGKIDEIKMEEKKINDTVADDDEKMNAEVDCDVKKMTETVDSGGDEVMDVSTSFENDTQKIESTQEATGETPKIEPTQEATGETPKIESTQDVADETHLRIDKSDEESMSTAELSKDCSSSQNTELDSDQQGVVSLPFNNCLTGLTQSSREIAIVEHSNYSNIYISTQTISKLSIIDTRFAGGSSEISSITSDIKSINTQLKSMTSQLKMSSTSYTPAIESGSNTRAICSAVVAPGAPAAATSCAQFDATNVTCNEQDKINNEALGESDEEESTNIKNETIDTSAAEHQKSDNITLNVKDCEVHVEEDSTSENIDVSTDTKPNIEGFSSDLNESTDQALSSMNDVNLIGTFAESSTSLNLNESSVKCQNENSITNEVEIECVDNGNSALLRAETADAVSFAKSVLPSKANNSDDRTAHSSGLTVGEEITSAYILVNMPFKTEDTEETKHIQSVPVCGIADQSGEIINVHSDGSMQSSKHESQNKALSVISEESCKQISVQPGEQKILSKTENFKAEERTATLDCVFNTSSVASVVSDAKSHDQMSSEIAACGEVKDSMTSVVTSAVNEELAGEGKGELLHQSPSEADKVADVFLADSAVNKQDKSESVTNETCDTREENVGLNEAADSPSVVVKSARLSAVLAELKRGKRSGSQKPSTVTSKTEETSNLSDRTSSIISATSAASDLSSTPNVLLGSVSNVIPVNRVSYDIVSSVSNSSGTAENINALIETKGDLTGITEQTEEPGEHDSAATGGLIQDQNVTKNSTKASGEQVTECAIQPVSSEASLSTSKPEGSTSRPEASTTVPAGSINVSSAATSSVTGSGTVPSSQQSTSESTRIAPFKTSGKPTQAKVAPMKVSPMKHTATTSSQVSASSKSDDSVCSQQGSSMSTLQSLSSLNPSDLLTAAGSSSPLSMLTPEAAAQLPLLSTAAAASGQLPYIFMGFPLGISAQQLVGSTPTTQKQDVTQVKTIQAGVRQSDSQGSKSVMGRGAVDQKNKNEGPAAKRRRPAPQRAASSAATVPAHSSNTPRFSPFNSPLSNQMQPCRPAHQSERPLGELLALHARSEAERLSHALRTNRVLTHSESLPAHLDPTSGRLLINEGFAGLSTAPVLPDERNFGLDLRRNSSASCSYTGQSDSVDQPLDYTRRSLDEFNRISQSDLYDEAGALNLSKK